MERTIRIKHLSQSAGHRDYQSPISTALQICRSEANKGMWIFIDGAFRNPNELTAGDLDKAEEITISPAVVGG